MSKKETEQLIRNALPDTQEQINDSLMSNALITFGSVMCGNLSPAQVVAASVGSLALLHNMLAKASDSTKNEREKLKAATMTALSKAVDQFEAIVGDDFDSFVEQSVDLCTTVAKAKAQVVSKNVMSDVLSRFETLKQTRH